jgi:putative SOS response-associated peptidase YedK
MCGRFALTSSPQILRATFSYVEQPNFPPRYNIAPTQPIAIVRMDMDSALPDARHFALVRWGFLPSFVKEPKDFPLIINARAETLAQKASFKHALQLRRCIIIADAFYEWKRSGKSAKPFLIKRVDDAPLALAGVWETWSGPHGEEMETACIVTTSANAIMAPVHHRMPVILESENFDIWLNTRTYDIKDALELMQPAGDDILHMYEISTRVNRAVDDDPAIQQPVDNHARETSMPTTSPVRSKTSSTKHAPNKSQGDLF